MIRVLLVAGLLVLLSGCASTLSGTNQLYAAQSYLPLPAPCRRDAEKCGVSSSPAGPGAGSCILGSVVAQPFNPQQRDRFNMLPGMGLQVQQTTYGADSAARFPTLSHWEWRLPDTTSCSNGGHVIGSWQRSDLLVLRHLLTSAQLPSKSASTPLRPLSPDHFAKAIAGVGACDDMQACLATKLYQPFADGLYLDIRELSNVGPNPVPQENGVRADDGDAALKISKTAGLARWAASLSEPRRADAQVVLTDPACSAASIDDLGDPREACSFAQATLGWRRTSAPLPGEALSGYSELVLLRTSDPLLAMRPPRSKIPLDPASGTLQLCEDSTTGKRCILDQAMVRGFDNIALVIPVFVRRRDSIVEQLTMVPVGTTIANFIRSSGPVRRIERSVEWLPVEVTVTKGKPLRRSSLADGRGRVTLLLTGGGARRGLKLLSDTPEDILLAPGDLIFLSGR